MREFISMLGEAIVLVFHLTVGRVKSKTRLQGVLQEKAEAIEIFCAGKERVQINESLWAIIREYQQLLELSQVKGKNSEKIRLAMRLARLCVSYPDHFLTLNQWIEIGNRVTARQNAVQNQGKLYFALAPLLGILPHTEDDLGSDVSLSRRRNKDFEDIFPWLRTERRKS